MSKIQECIGLLNSMVENGEVHSWQSREVVGKAKEELKELEEEIRQLKLESIKNKVCENCGCGIQEGETMNKIKEFLGNDAVKAVESDEQKTCKLLCDALELVWDYDSKLGVIFWFDDDDESLSYDASDLLRNLSLVREVEKAVIQKVGIKKYGFEIAWLACDDITKITENTWDITEADFCCIATADAKTKLAAMLLALREVEDE